MLPELGRGAPTARLGIRFGYGLAYAIASLSCMIGPFLAVTSTSLRGGCVGEGVPAYLACGAGMACSSVSSRWPPPLAGSAAAARARRVLPHVNRISGVLLVLVGLYVGYYGMYELRLHLGDGDPADPVIDTASRVQTAIAGWVDTIGPVPLVMRSPHSYSARPPPPGGAAPAPNSRRRWTNNTLIGSTRH